MRVEQRRHSARSARRLPMSGGKPHGNEIAVTMSPGGVQIDLTGADTGVFTAQDRFGPMVTVTGETARFISLQPMNVISTSLFEFDGGAAAASTHKIARALGPLAGRRPPELADNDRLTKVPRAAATASRCCVFDTNGPN
jgi:hypothetical protein